MESPSFTSKRWLGQLFTTSALASVTWGVLYFTTLGFAPKYRERLRSFESLDPEYSLDRYERYSEPASFLGYPYVRCDDDWDPKDRCPCTRSEDIPVDVQAESTRTHRNRQRPTRFKRDQTGDSLRTKQVSSVITATSAASLAIPQLAGPDSYWMVNTCFCAAFGVSLEGLILVTYITIIAAGTSDETLGLLSQGKLALFGGTRSARPAALIMALPVVFTTYSSLFLLIGSVVMVTQGPQGADSERYRDAYRFLSLIPVGSGFVCMCAVVLICEVGTYYEFKTRQIRAEEARRRIFQANLQVAVGAAIPEKPFEHEDTRLDHVSDGYTVQRSVPPGRQELIITQTLAKGHRFRKVN
ncbi:hypothetical protein BDV93DRAFT_515828 [Ceratobasidium sp. AG-I]|nr:hypothetical protein BDV93DRAFT_515828 [Ceratobasidium sp. AG-I]